MSNCRGCGTLIDPTENEVNQGVTEILNASLQDAIKHGEICPLCGHSKAEPISHRKSVQFGLLLAVLLIGSGLVVTYWVRRNTERRAAAQEALRQIESNAQMRELLGVPVRVHGRVTGQIKQDETGWTNSISRSQFRAPRQVESFAFLAAAKMVHGNLRRWRCSSRSCKNEPT